MPKFKQLMLPSKLQKISQQKTTVQQKLITENLNKIRSQNDSTSSQNNFKKSSSTQVQAKAPSSPSQTRHKSPSKVVSDRLTKGSDDGSKQYL